MKAIEVLFMFFTAVIAGDFKAAHGLTSKTWGDKNGPDKLKEKFKGTPDGLTFEIDRVITDLPTEQTHLVSLTDKGKTASAKVTLVREAWPGKRNPQGDWGVNPELMDPIGVQDAKVVKGDDELKKLEAQLKAAQDLIAKGETDKAEKILSEIPEDKVPQIVSEQLKKQLEKLVVDSFDEVLGPESNDYGSLLAVAEDLGIDIPEDAEPSLDDLKDLIFKEQERLSKEAKAAPPAKKPAAKKPAAKKPAKKGGTK